MRTRMLMSRHSTPNIQQNDCREFQSGSSGDERLISNRQVFSMYLLNLADIETMQYYDRKSQSGVSTVPTWRGCPHP